MGSESEVFFGNCLSPENEWMPPVVLNGPSDVMRYVNLHRKLWWQEVKITDSADFTVVHVVKGEVTFPPEVADYFKKLDAERGPSDGN